MNKRNIHVSVKIDGKTHINNQEIDSEADEIMLAEIGNSLKDLFPESEQIHVQYEVFNSISETWMCMASYYTEEKRYVKHT